MNKNITVEFDSFSDIIEDLKDLESGIDVAVLKAAKAYGEAGIKAVQQSYLSVVPNSRAGDYIYSSIGSRMIKDGLQEGTLAWGGVGVYMIDSVEAAFGRTEKDITAPQMAHWLEYGTTRYKSGASKPASTPWSEGKKIAPTTSSTPRAFVSNAMIMGAASMNDAFDRKLDELIG